MTNVRTRSENQKSSRARQVPDLAKKSVLILGNYPPPFGGVPRHIEYLAPFLVGRGWDVQILSIGRTGVEARNGITVHRPSFATKIARLGTGLIAGNLRPTKPLLRLLLDAPADALRYWAFAGVARRIVLQRKISVVSAYNLASYVPIGAMVAQEFGLPLLVNNLGEIYNASRGSYLEQHLDMVRQALSVATRFVAPTVHCAESYKVLGLSPDVEVVHHGIDLAQFNPANDGGRIRQRLGISGPCVLYVGRMVEDMGLDTLMEAIPRILSGNPSTKFLIVGQKGALFASAVQLAAARPGVVFVQANVPLEDLPSFYAAADVVVVPTKGDRACGALAAAEASATAKPVIAARVGGVPEFVAHGETGVLIPPSQPEALATEVLAMLADSNRARSLGERGRKFMERHWDVEQTNMRMEEILAELASTSRRNGSPAEESQPDLRATARIRRKRAE